MKYIPCPCCEKLFESDEKVNKHIRSIQGHGKEICPNCKKPLAKCKDVGASGQNFQCLIPTY